MSFKTYFTAVLFSVVCSQISVAQSVTNSETLASVDFKPMKKEGELKAVEEKKPDAKKQKEAVPYYYRHHRKLSASYTGYAIELTRSDLPLKRSHKLFRQFGNVYYDQIEGEGYAYVIKVDFSNKKAVKKFLEETVHHRAPDARIVTYKMGHQ